MKGLNIFFTGILTKQWKLVLQAMQILWMIPIWENTYVELQIFLSPAYLLQNKMTRLQWEAILLVMIIWNSISIGWNKNKTVQVTTALTQNLFSLLLSMFRPL